jgi:hypothetical protein
MVKEKNQDHQSEHMQDGRETVQRDAHFSLSSYRGGAEGRTAVRSLGKIRQASLRMGAD